MTKKLLFPALSLLLTYSLSAQWAFRAPMSGPRGQHGAVSHPNGNVYIFGGFTGGPAFNTLLIYNEAGNSWSTGANIPSITRGPAYCLGQDSSIYCFGGYDPGWINTCYKYKPSTNTWTPLANLPTACWYAAAATAPNGKIYVIGGENAMNLVQIYDPVANTWSSGTAVPVPVKEHAAVAFNGKIYVIGGLNGSATAIGNVQIYDPVANSWTTGTAMPTVRNEFAYALGGNGKIYCIGGKTNGGNNSPPFFTVVESYDPVGNSWSSGPVMPKGLGETAAAAINNGINVFGGADSSLAYSSYNLRLVVTATGIETSGASFSFGVFPNPSSDGVHFALNATSKENISMKMIDMNGSVIYEKSFLNFSGTEEFYLDTENFSRGVYAVQFTSGKEMVTKKLVLQ